MMVIRERLVAQKTV
jgi:hypothetical protein